MKKWLMMYLWMTFESKIKTVAQHLRLAGVKRFGGVGFGFGAWIVCYTSVLVKDMQGGVLISPLASEIEEMMGGDPYVMASRVGCPILIMSSKMTMPTYKPGGEVFDILKGR